MTYEACLAAIENLSQEDKIRLRDALEDLIFKNSMTNEERYEKLKNLTWEDDRTAEEIIADIERSRAYIPDPSLI